MSHEDNIHSRNDTTIQTFNQHLENLNFNTLDYSGLIITNGDDYAKEIKTRLTLTLQWFNCICY